MQPGEGKLHFRLHAGGAHHPKLRRLLNRVLQKRRLAHARPAPQHERLAFACADGVDEPVEHVAFAAAARQRNAAANWGEHGHLAGDATLYVCRQAATTGHWRMRSHPAAPHSRRCSERRTTVMTTVEQPGRFTTLPDEETLAATVVALEEHGFRVEVVDDLDAAREAVLARIPEGSSVMSNTSVTLQEAGIAAAVDEGGRYESARNKMMALDFATQLQEMKAIAGQPDFALGSVHAVTRDGTLVIASASGSQLASYVWGAANVIFVVGAQKLVSDAEEARERNYEHSLPPEDARAYA